MPYQTQKVYLCVVIESIWLRRVGGEDDPHAKAIVLVKLAGEDFYRTVITEPLQSNFSHAVHGGAIEVAPMHDIGET